MEFWESDLSGDMYVVKIIKSFGRNALCNMTPDSAH